MIINKPKNKNYCATIVSISTLNPLPKCDNVVQAIIYGNSIIVGKDTKIGDIGLYFPLETKLSEVFLSNNNLFRNKELNKDKEKCGYFEDHGRIKAVKFRGHKSEGFFIPLNSLDFLNVSLENLDLGTEFDELNTIKICEKYIPANQIREQNLNNKSGKKAVKIDRLVENQFRLHNDTSQLKKNLHLLFPDDIISITNKLHGTSFVVGKVLVKKQLTLKEKIAKFFGVNVIETEYDTIYSSRNVVKNKFLQVDKNHNHFYSYDLWEDIKNELEPFIQNGITLYGEAVGYLKTGKMIQSGYHYGAKNNCFDIYIYRITSTNLDGKVIEFSWNQIKEYCKKYDIKHVPEFFYGRAIDFKTYTNRPITEEELGLWRDNFLKYLSISYSMNDSKCYMNNSEVPAEGVVIKVDKLESCEAYKLKNYLFLERETKELDKGEVDIETQESLI